MTEVNFLQNSHIFSTNFVFIEELFKKYNQNPNLVDKSWHKYFSENKEEIENVINDSNGASWSKKDLKVIGSNNYDISSFSKIEQEQNKKTTKFNNKDLLKLKVLNLILCYRIYGHESCNLDPLGISPGKVNKKITTSYHNIFNTDLDQEIDLDGILGFKKAKVSDIVNLLDVIYSSNIASEFAYISNEEQVDWICDNLQLQILKDLNKEEKVKILEEVVRSTKFEEFLHKRFPGAKRFSVEGGESSICCIEKIIDSSAKSGVKKVVIGMAHRGRLNVLTGVLGKPYHETISGFMDIPSIPSDITEMGDVKYHMGYANSREIEGNKIDISLAFNPSHLEAVNSVVMGRVRAKQELYGDKERSEALPLIIHGDAAFSGQGSVAETLMMSDIEGYRTGGVIHLIINNQIGFTANPKDSRSTSYASDLAKSIDAPIFHVNGDDVESVVKIANLSVNFRQKFKKDIVIDLICYRKYGHNEGDEPMYTQPLMYTKIKNHPNLEEIYSQNLINNKTLSNEQYEDIVLKFNNKLNKEFDLASKYEAKEADWLKKDWSKIKDRDLKTPITAISKKEITTLLDKITYIPDNFNINPKIERQIKAKIKNFNSENTIDWGTAEAFAFASLLKENYPVRITGQDAGRGTFSHRHSVYHDFKTAEKFSSFNHIDKNQAKYEVHDSFLSEYAVLGFEYGYSLSTPYGLTIWEAQFGDFANGAQIIFDQFICSSEEKWLRKSNLVMLLPHGYEGQGPEHSSARLERYLQSCANDNMFVVNITSPANFFHALRRQVHLKDRKPLVVMSPKSLLRNPLATSSIEDFTGDSKFQEIIPETEKLVSDNDIKKVILCSGKIYYDLINKRQKENIDNIAIIRLEQLYPLPKELLQKELKKYKNANIVWCQEEPKNMGAWSYVNERIEELLIEIGHKFTRAKFIGRIASASTATGYSSYHKKDQENIINQTLLNN